MEKSLSDLNASVSVANKANFLKRLLAFSGPAFMVSVGYMDPGNWATDLAGGAQFGYKLIWIILLANVIAILFQTLSARLGIVTGKDLAQACRDHYPRYLNFILWLLCEVAIAACDLAEVIGSAIGFYLLFKIPLLWGVIITTFDVLLLMGLLSLGIRKMEAFIVALITTIGLCFAVELFIARPDVGEVLTGFVPTSLPPAALFIALGIIGATVMPHNLYLHSALVQSRKVDQSDEGRKQANKFNFFDSFIALNGAFLVNAAILIVAACVFFKTNHTEIASIIDAHKLLSNIVGSRIAPIAFGIALLAAGQSSTITGTFAGQIIMEGFVELKIRPWLRRLVTRIMAVTPAVFVILKYGDTSVDSLLILSQVILSLQLPFAILPLIHFTSSKIKMKNFASGRLLKVASWLAALFITSLNLKFIFDLISESFSNPTPEGWIIKFFLLPVSVFLLPLLIWVMFEPVFRKIREQGKERRRITQELLPTMPNAAFKKIGIALEGDYKRDLQIVNLSIPVLKPFGSEIVLIHCVQTATGIFHGNLVADQEAYQKEDYLKDIADILTNQHFKVTTVLGGGEPEEEIVRIARESKLDMIITGSHGHRFISDLIYGSTVDGVRHRTRLPVLAFPIN